MNDAVAELFRRYLADSIASMTALAGIQDSISTEAGRVQRCLSGGGTVFACGNGGSAADAQHFAAELVGRFEVTRPGERAVALTVDASILTALGNDFGFDQIFARQIAALGRKGDLLIGISTSGRSTNVIEALMTAQRAKMDTLLLTGQEAPNWGGPILKVPASRTALIQQLHITVLHLLCLAVDAPK